MKGRYEAHMLELTSDRIAAMGRNLQRRCRIRTFLSVTLSVCVLLSQWGWASEPDPSPTVTQDKGTADRANQQSVSLAPNWILSTPDGTTLSLSGLAEQGKTTVMVFWSTWCKNCKTLLPKLDKLMDTKGQDRVQVVLMNVWEDGDPLSYVQEHEISFPLILRTEAVAQRYQISVTPGIVIVDEHRHLKYIRPPNHGVDDVVDEVAQWVAGATPTGSRAQP